MTGTDSQAERLTPKQEQVIALLLAGLTITAAAAQTGIGEKTAHRWIKLPHFQAAYRDAQKEMFDEALARLRELVPDALATLRRHINAEVEPTAATQLRAALGSIAQSVQLHKVADLEARIVELETQFGIRR